MLQSEINCPSCGAHIIVRQSEPPRELSGAEWRQWAEDYLARTTLGLDEIRKKIAAVIQPPERK
jgi:hypothetical protein